MQRCAGQKGSGGHLISAFQIAKKECARLYLHAHSFRARAFSCNRYCSKRGSSAKEKGWFKPVKLEGLMGAPILPLQFLQPLQALQALQQPRLQSVSIDNIIYRNLENIGNCFLRLAVSAFQHCVSSDLQPVSAQLDATPRYRLGPR